MSWDFEGLEKSRRDVIVAGVCGGLGEHTPVPVWMWRAFFVAISFLWGAGLPVYAALWIFMPRANVDGGLADDH